MRLRRLAAGGDGGAQRAVVQPRMLAAGALGDLDGQRLQAERRLPAAGRRVGVILTGGNVDLDALPWAGAR